MDQGLTGCPREERADDVCVNDIRKVVTSFREPLDVISQGLVGLLLAALEVPGIPKMNIHPLEIPDEDPFEIRLVSDGYQAGGIRAMLEHALLRRWGGIE